MSILVTGGAGFIGSHVVERLLAEGHRVLCLDDFNDFYDPAIKRCHLARAMDHPKFTLIEGDIRDEDLVNALFEAERPDRVVHLAARAGVRSSLQNPLLYQDVNVRGTLNLLEASRRNGVGRFVFASSSSVYGQNSKVPFCEEDRVDRPISPYAFTKIAGELQGFTYHQVYGISVLCLRFFTVYGPRQRPDMAIHKFTRRIAEGQPVPMYGDGTTRRDYTYVDDIVDGILRALEFDGGYEIFNLGESRTVELRYLIGLIETNLGKAARIRRLPEQPGDVSITYAEVSKARRMLGYDPKMSVEEGVERFVRWWKEKVFC